MLTTKAAHRKDVRTAANGVHMQHRHFAFIAATLASFANKATTSPVDYAKLVCHFESELAGTNPNFNKERFYAACYEGTRFK